METSTGTDSIKVWDLPVRVFHWSLVGLMAFSWWSAEEGEMDWHMWSGLAILALIIFRLIWGFLGSSTARFLSFLSGPGAALQYVKAVFSGAAPKYAGHNPMGGWVVMLMLLVLGGQAILGLFSNDDILFDGPLTYMVSKEASDDMTGYHHLLFNVILAVVALHILAALFYLFVKKDNLIRPMITGWKHRDQVPSGTSVRLVNPIAALLVLAASAGFVWWLIS